jgi:hypothetical protein
MNPDEEKEYTFEKFKNQKLRIHGGYIIGILVLAIITLAAIFYGQDQDIKDILNFAVGFTSMILAILAIVYAFFANNSFDRSINKIESASKTVKQDTQSANSILKTIETVVNSIPERLSNIEKQVSSEGKQAKPAIPSQDVPEEASVLKFAMGVVERYMSVTSGNGLKLLYLCHLAMRENLPSINLRDLRDPDMGFDYAYGYMIAAYSAGFVIFGETQGIIKIVAIPTGVIDKLLIEIEKRKVSAPGFASQIKKIEDWVVFEKVLIHKIPHPVNP